MEELEYEGIFDNINVLEHMDASWNIDTSDRTNTPDHADMMCHIDETTNVFGDGCFSAFGDTVCQLCGLSTHYTWSDFVPLCQCDFSHELLQQADKSDHGSASIRGHNDTARQLTSPSTRGHTRRQLSAKLKKKKSQWQRGAIGAWSMRDISILEKLVNETSVQNRLLREKRQLLVDEQTLLKEKISALERMRV